MTMVLDVLLAYGVDSAVSLLYIVSPPDCGTAPSARFPLSLIRGREACLHTKVGGIGYRVGIVEFPLGS